MADKTSGMKTTHRSTGHTYSTSGGSSLLNEPALNATQRPSVTVIVVTKLICIGFTCVAIVCVLKLNTLHRTL
jgi:hypothetical protein